MDRRYRLTLLGLVALAALLRLPTLDVQSLWSDEAATAAVLQAPLDDLYAAVRDSESTPPLFYLLAWPFERALGGGEVALRLLPALCGVLLVPVLAAAGRRLGGDRTGLLAGLLAATSPLLWWFAQEARAYALLALLSGLALLALLRAVERPDAGRCALWGLAAAGAFATHWFAVFVLVPQAAWLALALGRRPRALAAAAAAPVAVGVALLPLLLDQREAGRATFIADQPLGERLASVLKQGLAGYDAPGEAVITVVAALAALAAVAALARRPGPSVRPLVAVLAVSLLLPLAAAATGDDYVVTRNVLASLPLVLLLLAEGLARLPARAGAAAAGALALAWTAVAVGVPLDPLSQREDHRGAAQALPDAPEERLVVVLPASTRVGAAHYLPGTRLLGDREAVAVREVDVVAVAAGRPGGRRDTRPLEAAGVAPAAGFVLAADRRETAFRVVRWTAPAPVTLSPLMLAGPLPGAAVLAQRP